MHGPLPPFFPISERLSAETQLLDDSPVSLDVHLLKVVQKLAALADQAEKGTTGDHVLLVLLHVLSKVSDTVGKSSNLTLRRAGVLIGLSVLRENLLLFLRL